MKNWKLSLNFTYIVYPLLAVVFAGLFGWVSPDVSNTTVIILYVLFSIGLILQSIALAFSTVAFLAVRKERKKKNIPMRQVPVKVPWILIADLLIVCSFYYLHLHAWLPELILIKVSLATTQYFISRSLMRQLPKK